MYFSTPVCTHFNPQNNLQNKEHVKDICCGLNPNNIHIEGRRHPSTIEVTLTMHKKIEKL